MSSVNVKVIEPRSLQPTSESDSDERGQVAASPRRLLQVALAMFGATFLLIYPWRSCGHPAGHGTPALPMTPSTS